MNLVLAVVAKTVVEKDEEDDERPHARAVKVEFVFHRDHFIIMPRINLNISTQSQSTSHDL